MPVSAANSRRTKFTGPGARWESRRRPPRAVSCARGERLAPASWASRAICASDGSHSIHLSEARQMLSAGSVARAFGPFGCASTVYCLPSPVISVSALFLSSSAPNRTKPNPFDLPVVGSVTTFAARACRRRTGQSARLPESPRRSQQISEHRISQPIYCRDSSRQSAANWSRRVGTVRTQPRWVRPPHGAETCDVVQGGSSSLAGRL